MNRQKITTVIFSLALFTFIAISVPHLAWVFHSFEADGTGNTAVNISWWVLSYCEAIGIDVLIYWLTVVQTTEHPTKAGVVWVFTFLLCLWSWYCNYLYTIAHASTRGAIWNSPLMGTPVTAGWLTPFVVSALPLFILCYKYIQSMLENGTVESIEALAARVADLQQRKVYEQQLAEMNTEKFMEKIKRGVSIARDTVNTLRGEAEQEQVNTERNTEQEAIHPVNTEQYTEPIPIHLEQEQVNREGTKERVKHLLTTNPEITLSQIVAQTGISRTRASVVRKEILSNGHMVEDRGA